MISSSIVVHCCAGVFRPVGVDYIRNMLNEVHIWHQAKSRHPLVKLLSWYRLFLTFPEREQRLNQIAHSNVQVCLYQRFWVVFAHGATAIGAVLNHWFFLCRSRSLA